MKVSANKDIALNSVFLYLRMILLMIVSLISVRVVVRSLGVEDYGIYSAIGGIVTSFTFLSQTLISASQRYFAYYLGIKNYNELNKTFAAIIVANLIIAVVFLILSESIGLWLINNKMQIPPMKLSQAKFIFHTSVISFIINLFINPLTALVIANEDMKAYAYISLFEGIIKLCAAVLLLILPYEKLKLYGFLLLIVSLIVLIIYYSFCRTKYEFIKANFHVSVNRLKEIFTYSAWTLFGTIAGVANNQGINILLNVFWGPIANAAQAIAHQVSGIVNQVCASFYSAVRPPLTKSFAIGDMSRCTDLFNFSNKILFFLLSLVFIPLYVEMSYILNLWLGNVEQYMVSFSKLMLINVFILCLSYPITTIVQASGRVGLYHGVVDGFAMLVLPAVYVVLKYTDNPDNAFVIANVIFFIAHILRLIILKRVIEFSIKKYFSKFLLPAIFAFAFSMFIVSLSLFSNIELNIVRLIIRIVVTLGVLCISMYFFLLTKNEKQYVTCFIKNTIASVFRL